MTDPPSPDGHRPPPDPPTAGEVGEVIDAEWEVHQADVAAANAAAMARRLPGLMRAATALAWQVSRADTITVVACNLAAGIMTTTTLLATQRVLEHLLAGMPTVDRLRAALPALMVMACLSGTRAMMLAAAGRSQQRLRPMVDRIAEQRLFETTTKVDAAAFEATGWTDAMLRARDQGVYRASRVVVGVSDLLTGLVSVAATIITLAFLNPLLVPLAILATLPDGWAALRVARMQYAVYRAISRVRRRMWLIGDRMADRDYALELRANTLRAYLLGQWGQVADTGMRKRMEVADRETVTRLAGNALSGVAALAMYAALGALLITGMLALAVAGTAALAMQTTRSSLNSVLVAVSRLYEDGLYFADLEEFTANADANTTAAAGPAPQGPPAITCTDVGFTYPGSPTAALSGVSASIAPGQIVALVGENGSGKSTLAKLLAGLYTPTSGTITWDGTDITGVEPDRLRARIAVITQDHVTWPLTARANVAMGLPRDPDRLVDATAAGCADQIVLDLPDGFNTILDKRFEGGTELSGGGRQRIAAARGIYRANSGAALVIADEPTSEVDAKAEHALLQSLLDLRSPDRALVLITHRLSAVRDADQILVLDHGRIIETGDHTSLMATPGSKYREMFLLQASRYATGTSSSNGTSSNGDGDAHPRADIDTDRQGSG